MAALTWANRQNLLASSDFHRANSSYIGSLQKTEDLLRGSKLRNLTLQNGNLITLGGIYGEQYEQSKLQTWQSERLVKETTEDMLLDIRTKFGHHRQLGESEWDAFGNDVVGIVRGLLGGASFGLGSSVGSAIGTQLGLRSFGKPLQPGPYGY